MTDTVPSAPRRRSLLEGFNEGMQSMGMWYERLFEKYGELVYDNSLIVLGVFFAVYFGLSFGLYAAEEEVDIDELWVEEGTRLRDERDEFDRRWGGISHLEIIALTKNNGGYVSTKKGVRGMIEILNPILRVPETGAADTNITQADALSLTYSFDGTTIQLYENHVCESPTASSLFGNDKFGGYVDPSKNPGDTSFWNASAFNASVSSTWLPGYVNFTSQAHISLAGVLYTNAMIDAADSVQGSLGLTSVTPASACWIRQGLKSIWMKDGVGPDGVEQRVTLRSSIPASPGYTLADQWTIGRFPCIRGGPMDCFMQGNFDYPYDLKRFDGLGFVLGALLRIAGFISTNHGITPGDIAAGIANLTTGDANTTSTGFTFAALADLTAGLINSPTVGCANPYGTGATATANINNIVGFWAMATGQTTGTVYAGVASLMDALATFNQTAINPAFTTNIDNATRDAIKGIYSIDPLGSALEFFGAVGYAWRKDLDDTSVFPNDEAIDTWITTSAANTQNSNYAITTCLATGACCPYWSTTRLTSATYLGTTFSGGAYDGRLQAFRTVINHFNAGHPVWIDRMNKLYGTTKWSEDDLQEVQDEYEQIMIDYLKPIWDRKVNRYNTEYRDYQLDFLMWRSATDVVREGGEIESGLIVAGYAILIVYACFSLARLDGCANFKVYSRSLVVVWGVFTVALATVAGFGLSSIIGWKLNPISIQLVPFLALGIGVDDMFVIAHTTVYHAHFKDPRERMVKSIAVAGPSVLLTSVTNATAFFLAVFTPIPAVRTFVLQMGITALLTIVALLTIFVPVLVWDSKRVAARNPELCFSCCKPDQVGDEAGDGERHGFINVATKKYIVPALKSLPGKIGIVIGFTTLFIVLTYLAFTANETGLRLSDVTLVGTYQRDYAELQEDRFPGYNNYMVTTSKTTQYQGTSFFCNTTDCKLFVVFELIDKMQASPYIQQGFNISQFNWPTSINSFASPTDDDYENVAAIAWNPTFEAWITSSGATSQLDMYCQDSNQNTKQCPEFSSAANDRVEATKMTIFNDNLIEHDRFLDTIRDARRRMDSVDASNSFVFGWMYQYWEQYLNIEENLYTVMGLSLAGVMGAIIIFQCDLISSLIVTIFILIIDLEVYGAISFMDVKINAFSVVNLVMTVGMAVEFTAHISHVFLLAQGNRNQRMGLALEEMMAPMLSGFLSSFFAVIPLAFARFPFFRTYYFGMFSVMLILAFLNGMIFMPVVLSLIGPGARSPSGGGFYKPTHSTNMQMTSTNEI